MGKLIASLMLGACLIGATACASIASASGPAPVSCDQPAQTMTLGQPVTAALQATSEPYPATAVYYCVAVGESAQSLAFDLTGLSADLDLYIGFGSITTVQGADISRGEHYEWKSNAFGAGDEHVTIENPQAGIYYVEIVSYQGEGSGYTLTVR